MTFYNIIFGILFLAACRQFLLLSAISDPAHIWMAATITVLIFNDAMNTSHVLEGPKAKPYSIFMKLIDLANFLLLSAALIALKPDDNPFDVQIPQALGQALTLWVFWVILIAYWALVLGWNALAGIYSSTDYPRWLKAISFFIWVPFLVMVFIVWKEQPGQPTGKGAEWGGFFAWLVPTVYLVICKPIAAWQKREVTG